MKPDTLAALAAYVRDQAVSSARITELIPDAYAIRCHAADGSEWHVMAEPNGNAYGWHATLSGAAADLAAALARKANAAELRALTADADNDPGEAEWYRHWQHQHSAAAARYRDYAAELRRLEENAA